MKEKKEASAKRKKESEDRKPADGSEEADEGEENEKENEDDVTDDWSCAVHWYVINTNSEERDGLIFGSSRFGV